MFARPANLKAPESVFPWTWGFVVGRVNPTDPDSCLLTEANALPAIRANSITKGPLPLHCLRGRLGALLYPGLLARWVEFSEVVMAKTCKPKLVGKGGKKK